MGGKASPTLLAALPALPATPPIEGKSSLHRAGSPIAATVVLTCPRLHRDLAMAATRPGLRTLFLLGARHVHDEVEPPEVLGEGARVGEDRAPALGARLGIEVEQLLRRVEHDVQVVGNGPGRHLAGPGLQGP